MEILTRTPWSRIKGDNTVCKEFLEIVCSVSPTGSLLEETNAVSATISISLEKLLHQIRLRILLCKVSGIRREPEVPEVSPSGRTSRWLCKDYLKGTCNNSFCKRWHPPDCLFYKTKSGCRFWGKVLIPTPSGWWTADKKVWEEWMMTKMQWPCWRRVIGKKENLSPINVTIDRGNLGREVIRNWDKIHLNVNHLMHGKWVVYFKTWSRRSPFSGRAQTCRDQSNV